MDALACFVSSHGFGHASRASAVLAALRARRPGLGLHLFTEVPAAFFEGVVPGGLQLHRAWTDVGLVQPDPFREDLAATARVLGEHLPFRAGEVQRLAAEVRAAGARAVLCDISPLGIAVAEAAGLPSILVENFTWHWIYRGLLEREPALGPFADLLERWCARATLRVQAAPVCDPQPGAAQLPPISRAPRLSRAEARARLGIGEAAPLVLLSLGGIPWDVGAAAAGELARLPDGVQLLVPAGEPGQLGPVRRLPRHQWFHPDLVNACDAVIGKVGYSTLAEVHRAGVPFGFVPRRGFPESPPLERFIAATMPSVEIAEAALQAGALAEPIAALLRSRRVERTPGEIDGAEQAAALVERFL